MQASAPEPARQTEPPQGDVSRAMNRGIAWTAAQMVGSNLLGLVVFVVLGRLLTPRAFGLVAAATVVILFLRVLVDAGFSRLLVQRPELTDEHVDTAFWTAVILGVGFCILLAAAAPVVALIFDQPRLTNIVRALSVIFIFVSFDGTQSAMLERRMEFRSQAIRRLVAGLVSAVVAIVLAALGAGVWALVAQQLTLEGVTVLVLWSLAPWRPRARFSKACFRELTSFGLRYSGTSLLLYLSQNADNFLIGVVLGPVALGYYVIAYRAFVVATEVLVTTVNRVALTTFSRLQNDNAALNSAFTRATALTAYVTLPCFALMALLAHPLIQLVFGAKWTPAAPVLQALTVAGVVQGQMNFTGNYAIAVGRLTNQLLWLTGLVAVELIGFGVSVSYGIVAVAISLSAVNLAAWPVRLVQVSRWRGLSLDGYFGRILRLLLPTAAMAGAVLAIHQALGSSAVAQIGAELAVGGIAYLLVTAVIVPGTRDQLRAGFSRLAGRTAGAP